MNKVKVLYERLRALPWPALAPSVGHFPLYESLLAGCANRMARGAPVDVAKIPEPDAETVEYVNALRAKGARAQDEQAFLEYFDLLEEIRSALMGRPG